MVTEISRAFAQESVLGACILAASAGRLPASAQSGDPVPLNADYLEAAAFIDDSRQAGRQPAATQGDQKASPLFGLEKEPIAGEVAAKWRAVEADIDREQRVLARCRGKSMFCRCKKSALETLRTRRGDCEDYAIVKYVALLHAGLPPDDVRIVYRESFCGKKIMRPWHLWTGDG